LFKKLKAKANCKYVNYFQSRAMKILILSEEKITSSTSSFWGDLGAFLVVDAKNTGFEWPTSYLQSESSTPQNKQTTMAKL